MIAQPGLELNILSTITYNSWIACLINDSGRSTISDSEGRRSSGSQSARISGSENNLLCLIASSSDGSRNVIIADGWSTAVVNGNSTSIAVQPSIECCKITSSTSITRSRA